MPVLCCCWRQAGDTCCYGGSAGTYHWKALRERRRKRAQFVPSLTSMKSTKKEQISLLEKYSQRFSQKQKQKTNLMSEDQIKLFFFLRFVSFSTAVDISANSFSGVSSRAVSSQNCNGIHKKNVGSTLSEVLSNANVTVRPT